MDGHNNPPAPIDLFKERAERYVADAASFAKITDANAMRATDHYNLGTSLAGEIEGQRKKEKEYFLEGGRKVDATFNPVHTKVEGERKLIYAKLTAYANELKRRAAETERLAAEKLRLAEEEAAEAAREAEEDPFLATDAPTPDIGALTAEAKVAELHTMAAKRIGSASGGKAFAARAAPKTAEIIDPLILAAYLVEAKHPDMMALLQQLANQNARAKGSVAWPGTRLMGGGE